MSSLRWDCGHTLTRTEQSWDSQQSAWANGFRSLYSWDSLGRQYYEERQDYSGGQFVNRYDVTQTYDKNGNRTGYDKNVVGGYNSDYGKAYNLSYTFNSVNALGAVTDGDSPGYLCSVTCDANGNVTQVDESQLGKPPTPQTNHLYTYFTYDALNRLSEHKTKQYVAGGTNAWVWTERPHAYDALGRLVHSGYAQYNDGDPFPGFANVLHACSGSRFVQNVSSDGQSFGARWDWAGSGSGGVSAAGEVGVPAGQPLDHGAAQRIVSWAAYLDAAGQLLVLRGNQGSGCSNACAELRGIPSLPAWRRRGWGAPTLCGADVAA